MTKFELKRLKLSQNNNIANLNASISRLQNRFESNVAFTAGPSQARSTYTSGQTVIFDRVVYQVGGGYNPTKGVFTAPKAGLYLIFCTVVANSDNSFWTKIMINGSVKAGVMAYTTRSNANAYHSGSNLVVHQLQVGDRVWIEMHFGSTLYSQFPDTTFSVTMIN
ncbi:multimerin-2-like [Saccostrea cucullata]|uniref:multimerin-2-like n=1 Tax=Saccostrea cuccullata TaxID=36930 RepID=UPI002ED5B890